MAIAGNNETVSVQTLTKSVRIEIFLEGPPENWYIRVWRQDGFVLPDGSFLPQGAWRSLDIKPVELPTLVEYVEMPPELAQRLTQPLGVADILADLPTFVMLCGDALDRKSKADQEAANQENQIAEIAPEPTF